MKPYQFWVLTIVMLFLGAWSRWQWEISFRNKKTAQVIEASRKKPVVDSVVVADLVRRTYSVAWKAGRISAMQYSLDHLPENKTDAAWKRDSAGFEMILRSRWWK